MDADERLDLVDNTDAVIGTLLRSEYDDKIERQRLGYIRAVELFLVNRNGELWIPTRTAHKRIAPNGLDYSMGGHVDAGETYIQAALREIHEELALSLDETDLEYIHTFTPQEDLFYFRALYLYRSDIEPSYNQDDFASAAWMHPEEIVQRIQSGTPAKGSLQRTVQYLLDRGY